jgi:Chromatin associated protein KTI12
MHTLPCCGGMRRFDGLVMRFEPPDSRNRWDSPLFLVHPDEQLPFEQIYEALFVNKAPPPNHSTLPVNDIVFSMPLCHCAIVHVNVGMHQYVNSPQINQTVCMMYSFKVCKNVVTTCCARLIAQ